MGVNVRISEEIIRQGKAFSLIDGFFEDEVGTIEKYGALFRRVMCELKEMGKDPTPEDILRYAENELGRTLRGSDK